MIHAGTTYFFSFDSLHNRFRQAHIKINVRKSERGMKITRNAMYYIFHTQISWTVFFNIERITKQLFVNEENLSKQGPGAGDQANQ